MEGIRHIERMGKSVSADNGIYIVKFPDGYRTVHAQAIENIDFFPAGSKERKEQLKAYFGEAKVYKSRRGSINYAYKLAEGYPFLEYGISDLGEREAFE